MRHLMLTPLALLAAPVAAQTSSITLYELPAYLGRSVTITADTPDLAAQTFAKRAQSARVTGSWQVCPAAGYAGSCRTMTADSPYIAKSQVVSLRPAASSDAATTAAGTTAAAATVDPDALDAASGTEGQDVTFFARPALGGSEISAGTNDLTAASAFCKLAGATSATYAGRARVQTSNMVDIAARARVRGYALRDVVCRR